MGFRIYRTSDGSSVVRYKKIGTAIGGVYEVLSDDPNSAERLRRF